MIDLTKFKNTEENAQNRAQITQIGVLGAIDAYFEGSKEFTEEALQRMVLNNITKIGVYAGVCKSTEDSTGNSTPENGGDVTPEGGDKTPEGGNGNPENGNGNPEGSDENTDGLEIVEE